LDKIGNYVRDDERFIEVLIVDDGSSDESREVVEKKYLKQFPKLLNNLMVYFYVHLKLILFVHLFLFFENKKIESFQQSEIEALCSAMHYYLWKIESNTTSPEQSTWDREAKALRNALVESYIPLTYAVLRKRGFGSNPNAGLMHSDLMASLITGIEQYDYRAQIPFYSYIETVLENSLNQSLNQYGKMKILSGGATSRNDDKVSDPIKNAADHRALETETKEVHELKEKLYVAIATLEPEDRRLVELYFNQGKSYLEIGEITGVSKTTVGNRLKIIFEKLKEKLGDDFTF
jgi:RNA polymerase sigma factor (sigma-70 family)